MTAATRERIAVLAKDVATENPMMIAMVISEMIKAANGNMHLTLIGLHCSTVGAMKMIDELESKIEKLESDNRKLRALLAD